jgi:hypothetical protein
MTVRRQFTDPRASALVDALARVASPAFVQVPADELTSPALRAALHGAGWFETRLDRAPVVDKGTLLHALYQCGEYPAGFGFNWDALLDALRDLSWLEPASGVAMVWRHPGVLATRAPDVAATFREIVEEAAAHRAAHGYPPLRVLVPAGPVAALEAGDSSTVHPEIP